MRSCASSRRPHLRRYRSRVSATFYGTVEGEEIRLIEVSSDTASTSRVARQRENELITPACRVRDMLAQDAGRDRISWCAISPSLCIVSAGCGRASRACARGCRSSGGSRWPGPASLVASAALTDAAK
jgi:hypothetical protein